MTDRSNIREEALGWLVRTNDPAFADWEAFTVWLEESPANADAYHALAQSEIELAPFVAEVSEQEQTRAAPRGGRRLALAASLAAAVALGTLITLPRLMPEEHVTAPGQIATLELGGADRLVMNGNTRLSLAGWNRRSVRLAQGQILLQLQDRGRGPVEVTSGDLELVDVGTVFEVSRDGSRSRVLVSEGAVMADPDGARLTIDRGERLDTKDGARLLATAPADTSAVGTFATGQLTYSNEPLENVVADLRRSTGIDLALAPGIAPRRFSGTLSASAVRGDPSSLGPILDVAVRRTATGWRLDGKAPSSGP